MTWRAAVCTILLFVLAACGHKNGLVPNVPPPATLESYARIINAQAAINHVPAELIGAIVAVESRGNARATNPSGALGLMQLKPATAAHYGITDLYNPTANITAGTRYLHDLLTRFRGNITLAVAAYQAGPAAVIAAHGVPKSSTSYVDRVMTIYNAALRIGDRTAE